MKFPSCLLSIKEQEKAAIKALYHAFFGESKKTNHGPITPIKSLTSKLLGHLTSLSLGKLENFLVGDQALEFYPDVNVEQYIQIPGPASIKSGLT